MPATPEELARIISLENQFAAFLAGTLSPSELTGAQRKTIQNSLYPVLNGFRNRKDVNNFDYTSWEVNDEVQNIDDVGKHLVIGKVIAVPFDPSSDLDDRAKFDWYVDAKPKVF